MIQDARCRTSEKSHKEFIVKKLQFITITAMLLLTPVLAAASVAEHPGCSGNCMECHKIERKEADAVIKKLRDAGNLPQNVEVKEVKLAPVGGLWQIDLEANGQRGAVFIDFSKKYLLNVTQIFPIEAIKKQEPRKVDFSKLTLKDAVVLGAKDAKKKVAVFTDPDCPFCRKLHDEMKQVVAKRKDVAFHLILYPLPMHKDAYKKVQAVLCEKSLALLDDAFAGKAVPEPKCSSEAVERNVELAKKFEFGSTPTLVRDDGTVVAGALPADRLIEWIDGK
jgi:thiol:disulfide interchange protein DsbC